MNIRRSTFVFIAPALVAVLTVSAAAQPFGRLEISNWLADTESTGRMWIKGHLDGTIARRRLLARLNELPADIPDAKLRAATIHCFSAGQSLANAMLTPPSTGNGDFRLYERSAAECRRRVR